MSVLRRRDQSPASSSAGASLEACPLAVSYAAVVEHLSATTYPDGSRRVGSTLMVFIDSGTVKACLNDRDQGLAAWVSSGSLTGVLEALERGLVSDSLDWRQPPQGRGKKR